MKRSVLELVAETKRLRARERAERVHVLRLLKGRPAPIAVPVLGGFCLGWTLVVHRDTEDPTRWRMTRFDAAGEPSGHTRLSEGSDGFSRALREVQEWDGDLRFARCARAAALEER